MQNRFVIEVQPEPMTIVFLDPVKSDSIFSSGSCLRLRYVSLL